MIQGFETMNLDLGVGSHLIVAPSQILRRHPRSNATFSPYSLGSQILATILSDVEGLKGLRITIVHECRYRWNTMLIFCGMALPIAYMCAVDMNHWHLAITPSSSQWPWYTETIGPYPDIMDLDLKFYSLDHRCFSSWDPLALCVDPWLLCCQRSFGIMNFRAISIVYQPEWWISCPNIC